MPATGPVATSGPRSGAGLLLALLSAGYFLAYFDRLLLTAVSEAVKLEFALSDKQLSLLTGAAFVIVYGAAGIPMGWLADRWSRKRIVAWSLALWSLLTMFCGAAQSFMQLALARAGVGIGESAIVPVANSIIADSYAPAKRPMAIAVFYAGGTAGILACFVAGTWAAAHFGWRAAFLMAGPPGLALALLVAWLAREPARERVPTPAERTEGVRPMALVWNNAPLRWLLLGAALGTFINIGVVQWLPNFFIRSHHLSLAQVGLFFGPVLSAGMTAGLLLGGWIGNRIAAVSLVRLIWLSSAVLLVVIPVYLLIFWLPSLPAALFATFIGTALSVVYSAPFTGAWHALCDPRARGTAAGLSSFANAMIGGAIGNYLVGVLSDRWAPVYGSESLRYALMASMAICLLPAACFARAARLHTRQIQESAHGQEHPAR